MSRSRPWRFYAATGLLLAVAGVLLWRAARLQLLEHDLWAERARAQIVREKEITPNRGTIYDRRGQVLAASETFYEFGVAPQEVPDSLRGALRNALVSELGLSRREAATRLDTTAAWHVIPGRHPVEDRLAMPNARGLYAFPVPRRVYPQGDAAAPLLGRLDYDGNPTGGLERTQDSILRGRPGRVTLYRDVRGVMRTGGEVAHVAAEPGEDLHLTLDVALQEVAASVLDEALRETGARSADLVMVDVPTGDLLVAASRSPAGGSLAAFTTPYEPGSVLKPFTYAALLERGLLSWTDSVDGEDGMAVLDGRTVRDVHEEAMMTYMDALVVSSNIAAIKASNRIEEEEQYRTLRAFGFGEPTGLPVSSESAGRLRPVDAWSRYSRGSLAIGYEMSATPVQLAYAYAALGNGGRRMRPRLVRASRPGTPDANAAPEVVDQAVSEATARSMLDVLRRVVDEGSGQRANLGNYDIAGKTGTSRAWIDGGYNGHYASFVGLFPADAPQVVIVVRVAQPEGLYYGGTVAAPITRRLIEAALAAADAPLDRRAVAPLSAPSQPRRQN